MKTTLFDYDTARYPFGRLIGEYIGTQELETLHASYDSDPALANSLYKNMEQSPVFRAMYAGLSSPAGEEFYATYERFVREVIRPQYDGPIYYQTKPSHRILFADVPGQSRFHRDADYGHDPAGGQLLGGADTGLRYEYLLDRDRGGQGRLPARGGPARSVRPLPGQHPGARGEEQYDRSEPGKLRLPRDPGGRGPRPVPGAEGGC